MPYVDTGSGRRWESPDGRGPTPAEIEAELSSRGQSPGAATWGSSGRQTARVEQQADGSGRIVVNSGSGGGGGDVPVAHASPPLTPTPGGGAGGGGGLIDPTPAGDAGGPSMSSLFTSDPESPVGFIGTGIGSLRQGIGQREPPSLAALFTRRPY